MMTPSLVVFGCLTIDNVVSADGEVHPPYYGGNGLYSSLGANVWSERVGLVARRGAEYASTRIDDLKAAGVNVAGVMETGGSHELNIAFAYRGDGTRTREFSEEMLARIPPEERHRFWDISTQPDGHEVLKRFAPRVEDMPNDWWDSLSAVHCPSLPAIKTREIAARLRVRAGERLHIQVDSLWDDNVGSRARDAGPVFNLIDVLLPSTQDLLNADTTASPRDTARSMLRDGAKTIVVKCGAAGSEIFETGAPGPVCVPAFPVDAIDPTGAGDAFCGGFLAGYHLTGDVRLAALHGTVSASLCVEAEGADGLLDASRSEAQRRLDWLCQNTTAFSGG